MIPGKILEAVNPYSLYIKLGLGLVALAIIGYFVLDYQARGRKIERLTEWQNVVIDKVTLATVPDRKRLSPSGALTGIDTLVKNLDHANQALRDIDLQAQVAKTRAIEADRRLADTIAEYNRKAAQAQRRINDLMRRSAAKTPAEAAASIDADSKAAWEDWK